VSCCRRVSGAVGPVVVRIVVNNRRFKTLVRPPIRFEGNTEVARIAI
jgi:hypothetical protein